MLDFYTGAPKPKGMENSMSVGEMKSCSVESNGKQIPLVRNMRCLCKSKRLMVHSNNTENFSHCYDTPNQCFSTFFMLWNL